MNQVLTRKELRRLKRTQKKGGGNNSLPPVPQPPTLQSIKPITQNQNKVFKAFALGQHTLIHGYAGTGKSFLAVYLALNEVVNKETFKKVVIIRSAVPSRTQGFLPGNDQEKAAIFELPYRAIVDELYKRTGSYNRLKDAKTIDFTTTSFLRGITIDDAIIVVDEVQNMTDGEINTVMTRVGKNARVIVCGDFRQNDLNGKREESCIRSLVDTLDLMPSFTRIEMQAADIVRSGVVKEWILAREGR